MINGVRVRDSGVELSPTGTDRRGGPRTASNRTVRASSAIAAGSTRWLMRRTKRPLSATPEDRATHGHLWPPLYLQVAHCYALVKTSTRGTAQGLPAGPERSAFRGATSLRS